MNDLKDFDENGFRFEKADFLLNKTEKSIDLVTTFMFNKEKCQEIEFVAINSFSKHTMKWKNDNFYPRKYLNF